MSNKKGYWVVIKELEPFAPNVSSIRFDNEDSVLDYCENLGYTNIGLVTPDGTYECDYREEKEA